MSEATSLKVEDSYSCHESKFEVEKPGEVSRDLLTAVVDLDVIGIAVKKEPLDNARKSEKYHMEDSNGNCERGDAGTESFEIKSDISTVSYNSDKKQYAASTAPDNSHEIISAASTAPDNSHEIISAISTAPDNSHEIKSAASTAPDNSHEIISAISTAPDNSHEIKSAASTAPDNSREIKSATSTALANSKLSSKENVSIPVLNNEIDYLKRLFSIKELECNAIFKLMKLKEIEVAQLKRNKVLREFARDGAEEKVLNVHRFLQNSLLNAAFVNSSQEELSQIIEGVAKTKNNGNFNEELSEKLTQLGIKTEVIDCGDIKQQKCLEATEKRKIPEVNLIKLKNEIRMVTAVETFRTETKNPTRKDTFAQSQNFLGTMYNSQEHQSSNSGSSPKRRKIDIEQHISSVVTLGASNARNPIPYKSITLDTNVKFLDVLTAFKNRHDAMKKQKKCQFMMKNGTLVRIPGGNEKSLLRGSLMMSPKPSPVSKNLNRKTPKGSSPITISFENQVIVTKQNLSPNRETSSSQESVEKAAVKMTKPVSRSVKSKKQQKSDVVEDLGLSCESCRNPAMFICSSCQNQWYCSVTCQVAAWDSHQDVCVPRSSSNSSNASYEDFSLTPTH